jgi:dihydrofolate reductase/thymidylate synthase
MLSLIVAHDNKYGIGKNNNLPWKLSQELNYFKYITTKSPNRSLPHVNFMNAVIMGRKTWDSIPSKFRPLPDRLNIVLTRNPEILAKEPPQNTYFTDKLQEGIDFSHDYITKILGKTVGEIFIIGGGSIYHEAFQRSDIVNLYFTHIYEDFNCDTFISSKENFPKLVENYHLSTVSEFHQEKNIYFRYLKYQRKDFDLESQTVYHNVEEQQYLDLLYKIGLHGIKRDDRTGVGTISTFGEVQKFNLRDTFPILTTKRMYFKAIFEELMLYLRGQTDNKILQGKNIHIWDGNTSREFLDKRGLYDYEEGDMGETYGFNFRHFGGTYRGCQYTENKENGFDQLKNVIHLIKNNPTSRRMIITLWNPHTEHKAALPSCLCWYQFYVNPYQKTLSLLINIRSSDFFLANNWNVCTGALLTHLICNLEDIELTPGDLTVISGDTHIYLSHLEQVKLNLERKPRPFPKLVVQGKKNIEEYEYQDVKLLGYNPYPNIKAEMAV